MAEVATTTTTSGTGGNGQNVPIKVAVIPINKIRENKAALRDVDRENVDYLSLVDSVRQDGILNPIVVRELKDPETGEEYYGLIDGLHRWTAALDAGLTEIPVNIRNMDQAEAEEKQIIANAHIIETKPIQYTNQLIRLLARNPLMTPIELAKKLSKTTGWLYERFNLIKNLDKKYHELVDSNKIKLSNAYQLAKLQAQDQEAFIERAMTLAPEEFQAAVSQRVKEVREARRQGKAAGPVQFQPVAHQRKWAEVKKEYENPNTLPNLIIKNKITDPLEAMKFTLSWVANMDPDTQDEQKRKNAENTLRKEEEKKQRDAERARKRLEDAQNTLQKLGQPAVSTTAATAGAAK